jgi:hypothetical protein
MSAVLTPQLQGLKVKFGVLLRAVGGVEAAAPFCRVGKSVLAASGSINEPERFPAADAILDLETVTRGTPDWPVVTRYLARQQGFELVPDPDVEAGRIDLQTIAALSKEAGDVVSKIAANLEGGLTAEEVRAAAIEREFDELINVAVQGRAAVRAILRGEAR